MSQDNVLGVILLVGLIGGAIVVVLGWLWVRWGRGPFPLLMELLGRMPTWLRNRTRRG